MQSRRAFNRSGLYSAATLLASQGRSLYGNSPAGDWGGVVTINNDATTNRLLFYSRNAYGQLRFVRSVATGGKGSGGNLGSQGAISLNAGGNIIFAVNAGSNSITSFVFSKNVPVVQQLIDSGGVRPISLTVGRRFVYVVNNGAKMGSVDQINGFAVNPRSLNLAPLENGISDLSADDVSPGQISLDPAQKNLIVTEKATNLIDVFPLDSDGSTGQLNSLQSSGKRPFGFGFSGSQTIVVSEAASATTSSYRLNSQTSTLSVVTPGLSNNGPGACWVSVTQNGRYAYVSNFDSSQLTGFQVSDTGRLSPLPPAIFATPVVGNPIDSAIVGNRFFYLLSHFRNLNVVLSAFRINADGSLRPIGQISGLPLSTVGLAVY
jgi:hypothetical protein